MAIEIDDADQLDRLRAMGVAERRRYADEHAELLQLHARSRVELARYLVECDETRPFCVDGAMRAWLELDRGEALVAAVRYVDELDRATFTEMLAAMDASEAREFLLERVRADPDIVSFVAHTEKLVQRDDRFVDIALAHLNVDVGIACTLLGHVATERAVDELKGILERTARTSPTRASVETALRRAKALVDDDDDEWDVKTETD